METTRARTGDPLSWGLFGHPGLAESPHVAPPSTYPLAAAPGKPLPRPAHPGRGRAGPVLLRHALGPRLGPVHRRLVPGPAPGRAARRPAQAPGRALQGGPRQVRRQAGPEAPGRRRLAVLPPAVALGAVVVVGPAPGPGHRR